MIDMVAWRKITDASKIEPTPEMKRSVDELNKVIQEVYTDSGEEGLRVFVEAMTEGLFKQFEVALP